MNKTDRVTTEEWIKLFLKERARNRYDMFLTDFTVTIDGKMKKNLATYKVKRKNAQMEFKFAKVLFEGSFSDDEIISLIEYALVKWWAIELGKTAKEFAEECVRIGASTTGKLKYQGIEYYAICSCCGKVVVNSRYKEKLDRFYSYYNFKTPCCRAAATYGGERIVDVS